MPLCVYFSVSNQVVGGIIKVYWHVHISTNKIILNLAVDSHAQTSYFNNLFSSPFREGWRRRIALRLCVCLSVVVIKKYIWSNSPISDEGCSIVFGVSHLENPINFSRHNVLLNINTITLQKLHGSTSFITQSSSKMIGAVP